MDVQELLGLQEAYLSVYAPQELDELSVGKMLAYVKKGEKNRADLNKKWDEGTATHRERMRVLGREEGEARASDKVEKKTGKRPYEMNTLDKARYAVTKEDYVDEGAAGDVAARAEKLAAQRKGQTPERKQMYASLASKASERESGPRIIDLGGRGGRKGLTQSDRDARREYDAEYSYETGDKNSTPGPGTITKNKRKLATQKARGQHAEGYDLYDIILSHLIDEGYADTQKAAEAIMVNMSEDWRESIVETRMDPRGRPASGPMNVYGKSKPNTDPAFQAALKSYREKEAKKTPEQRKAELDAYKARQMNR
jgi:hypothetical protein